MNTPAATTSDRWFLGTLMRVVTGGDDTGGRLAVMEQWARKGFSPPRHVHHREETAMYVIEGSLTVDIGGELQVVGAGGFVWLPRDVEHTFRVDSEEARLLEFVTPAGFEGFHIDISDPAPTAGFPPAAPPDIERILGAIGRYGAEIVGPPMGP